MNLIEIKSQDLPSREGKATVRVNSKIGYISFNKRACRALGLIDKKIRFFQDSDRPGDWYLSIDDKDGLPVRSSKPDLAGVGNIKIARMIAESLGMTETFVCQLSTSPEKINKGEYYALITRSITK